MNTVRNVYRTLVKKESLRRIFAVAFLLLFLAEWTAHATIHMEAHSPEAASITTNQGTGDDPCHSFFHCDHERHKDRQTPNAGHDLTPNVLVDVLSQLDPPMQLEVRVPMPSTGGDGLFRPPDPTFHPPELS